MTLVPFGQRPALVTIMRLLVRVYWFINGAVVIVLYLAWFPDFVQWWVAKYSELPMLNFGDRLIRLFAGVIPTWVTVSVLVLAGLLMVKGIVWHQEQKR